MLKFFEIIVTCMIVTGQGQLQDDCSYIEYKSGMRNVAAVLEQCNCFYEHSGSYLIKTCSIVECSPDDAERIRVIEWNNTNNCYDGDLIKNSSVKISSYLSSDNDTDLDYNLYCNKNTGNSKQCAVVYREYRSDENSNASYCNLTQDFYSDTYTLGEFCYGPLHSGNETSYKTSCNGTRTFWSSGDCSGSASHSINYVGDCYNVFETYWTQTVLQSTCTWNLSFVTTIDTVDSTQTTSSESGGGTSSSLRIGDKNIIILLCVFVAIAIQNL